MDNKGNYTDHAGQRLAIASRVRMTASNQPVPLDTIGIVLALPKEGNDWHGFPHVDFGEYGKHHVPDSVLQLLPSRTPPTPEDTDTDEIKILFGLTENREAQIATIWELIYAQRERAALSQHE